MNYKQSIFCLLLSFCVLKAWAQKDSLKNENQENIVPTMYWHNKQEIGLSAMPLVRQLVPFNLSESFFNGPGILYKKYKNKRAFRVGFGSLINANSTTSNFVHFNIGTERRRRIYNKWTFTSGGEFVFSVDLERNGGNRIEQTFVGFSKFFALEYNFNEHMFLSTEAAIQMGLISFRFVQPTNIHFFYRF